MPETTTVTEIIQDTASEQMNPEQIIALLFSPENRLYTVIGIALLVVFIYFIFRPRPAQRCPCCGSGGRVIGGVRRNDTDIWVKEAKYCPLCGRQLRP